MVFGLINLFSSNNISAYSLIKPQKYHDDKYSTSPLKYEGRIFVRSLLELTSRK